MVPYNFLFILFLTVLGLCWASLVAQMIKHLLAMRETWVRSLGQEDPLEKDLCCWVDFSPVVENEGYSLAVVQGFLIAVYSLDAEHRLYGAKASAVAACGLSSCSSCALEHRLNSCGA